MYKCFCEYVLLFLLEVYLGVELLGRRLGICLFYLQLLGCLLIMALLKDGINPIFKASDLLLADFAKAS